MKHKDVRRSLYEYVRGELEPAQARQVEEHLACCSRCFGDLELLRESVRLFPRCTQRPSEDRSEAFWARFAMQVEERMRNEQKRTVVTNPVWERVLFLIMYRRPFVVTAAGAVAVAVVLLLLWPSNLAEQQAAPDYAQVGRGVAADPLRMELADYFRRSKILLVGISNISAKEGERVDLSVERQAARSLVQQARYLDNRVLDQRSEQLVQALERILLELANMEQQADLPDVEIIRSGIHEGNMLFRIRMAETEYNAPEINGAPIDN